MTYQARNVAICALSALTLALALPACGSSGSPTPSDGGAIGSGGAGGSGGGAGGGVSPPGNTSQGCSYLLGAPSCETYTGTASEVNGKISACMKVFGGTAVASCPTAGVVGKCTVMPDSANETDEISYYSADSGILSLSDLCDSANGTLMP